MMASALWSAAIQNGEQPTSDEDDDADDADDDDDDDEADAVPVC